jgi:hypothetical protein
VDTRVLLSEPFTFTQYRPLQASDFLSEARKCGLWLSDQEFEALHRTRLLVPFYRFVRDGREIAAAHRRTRDRHRHRDDGYHLAHWWPSSRDDLIAANDAGQLHDPATEPFIARRRLKRQLDEWSYESSVYLYSRHQLAAVPFVGRVRPALKLRRLRGDHVGNLDVDPTTASVLREQAETIRQAAIAATLLEPAYYSRIYGRLSLPRDEDFVAFDRWRRTGPLLRPLRALRVDAAWISKAAAMLHSEADRVDPLGDWAEVIAAGEPEKWKSLTGDARAALEVRVSAEFLLLYYDRLHKARRAPALPESPARFRGPFDDRLKRRRPLNDLLTDFGLSPHPRLVVAVEGETELTLFPRVMRQLEAPADDDFIAVEDAGGVDRDLSPLVAYAIAPRLRKDESDRGYVRLERPPTRLFVVFDAEGKFATPETRRERRDKWVARVMQTLPRELQTPVVAEQIKPLVNVATWTRTGTSFEFAHFTDLEIATAAAALDMRRRQPTFERRLELVGQLRRERGNLKAMLEPISKVALADHLWPVLERKIEAALEHGTERRIPIVRMVHQAYELAVEFPRRNLVIALQPQAGRRRRRRRGARG